jgi:biopolymer transport protein ExbD
MTFATGSSAQTFEINVTPLIDVLLVLLIIFMVIAPRPRVGLDSSIPQGKAAESEAMSPVVVRLLVGGAGGPLRYQLAGAGGVQDVAHGALRAEMGALFAVRRDRTVFVEADRDLSYDQVAEVIGVAHEAGAGAVVLSGLQQR